MKPKSKLELWLRHQKGREVFHASGYSIKELESQISNLQNTVMSIGWIPVIYKVVYHEERVYDFNSPKSELQLESELENSKESEA